jgi:hypothetical protein
MNALRKNDPEVTKRMRNKKRARIRLLTCGKSAPLSL